MKHDDASIPADVDNAALPLAGQRILVTRPAHQANALCDNLRQLGAEPIRFPTLAITPIAQHDSGYPLLKQRFLDLDLYHAVIFISANAVRLAYEQIDQYWPQLPLQITWLPVGSATASTLQRLLPEAVAPSHNDSAAMDSENLLALPELQQLSGKRVLICRGEGGRELLAQTLQQRGAQLDYAELYRREIPVYSQTEIESIIYKSAASAMLVSSGEALLNLVALTGTNDEPHSKLIDLPVVLPSQRVAALASKLGFTCVRVAANATDAAMITVLTAK
ncbi:MAG: uroporphyrinogen-III synthase [Motiliproteus sp.]